MDQLTTFNLLHQTQSGFRAGHSTESALIFLLENFLKAINNGNLVGCILVDFRKAFDLVDPKILLEKLHMYKCSDLSVNWFRSYLEQRNQIVSVNGATSGTRPINCGVPQGSILGPTLFLLFINVFAVYSPITRATSISMQMIQPFTTYNQLQGKLKHNLRKALDNLQIWCNENGMLLNKGKTKIMLITSRQKRTYLHDKTLELQYDNVTLLPATTFWVCMWMKTYSGMINLMVSTKKISSYLWPLSQIKQYLSIKHRTLFYKAYIQHTSHIAILFGEIRQKETCML